MANKNLFNSIKLQRPKRNHFDLSHDVKLSLDMGELVPILAMEAVPGDKFNLSCESLLRFSPMVAPVMHHFDVTMHYFFVPNRLVWTDWEKFITGDATAGAFPYMQILESNYGKLPDYLGIPKPIDGTSFAQVSALPFAAYQCVYNEYYRDQNLIAPVDYKLQSGDNTMTSSFLQLRKRAWMHDYFTSALPWAQKGAPVEIPLGTGTVELADTIPSSGGVFRKVSGGATQIGNVVNTGVSPNDGIVIGANTDKQVYDPRGSLVVETEATTINDLRRAFKLQEWLEKNARAGTRYVENILAHFGVKSSDARLQRPEYITGTKSPVVISEVLNTTGEDAGLPQGNMAGHGVSVTSGKYGGYFCEEHGYIIGIMSVLPKPAYQQGIPKHFLKFQDYLQYYWPSFAHLGEQEVQNQELYAYGATPTGTFGYVPRYAEYKYMPSRVAGDFKESLDHWHMGRIFASQPSLNQAFVECDPGKRIFAVVEENVDSLYAHVYNKISAVRPMPKFGTPMF